VARRRDPAQAGPSPEPQPHSGVFVTLHKLGRLRGCMGILDPQLPLADAVREAALCAASQDPRFPPVRADELSDLEVEVSILSPPQRMRSLTDLEIGRHGVLVRRGDQRGLFLPQVAVEHHLDRETFLSRCCTEKAGLPPDAWKDPDTEVLIFTAEVLHEP
jgi:AmmeMemoRadiSam system protein A